MAKVTRHYSMQLKDTACDHPPGGDSNHLRVHALRDRLLSLKEELHDRTSISLRKCDTYIERYITELATQIILLWLDHEGGDLYLNLDRLSKQVNTCQVNGERIIVANEIRRCKHNLFDVIFTGIPKKSYTRCRLKNNIKFTEIVLASGNVSDIIEHLYGEITEDSNIDWAPVDLKSLDAYIRANQSTKNRQDWHDRYLGEAEIIQLIAKHYAGYLPQIVNESEFGRRYYSGINLQNTSRVVRGAALGDCFQWDISNSVWSWKYHVVEQIYREAGEPMPYTLCLDYLERKSAYRKKIAHDVFPDMHSGEAIVKQALTAVSFGATGKTTRYPSPLGVMRTTAMADIIRSPEKLELFMNHLMVKPLIQEQKEMNRAIMIYLNYREEISELKKVPALVDARGALKPNGVIAYQYQHWERHVMDQVCELMERHDETGKPTNNVLLRVHDAVYTRKRPNAQKLQEIKLLLQDQNREIRFEETLVEGWSFDNDMLEHRQRIAEQEALAQGYRSPLINTDGAPVTPEIEARIGKHDGEYKAYTGTNEHTYDPDFDPWLDDYEPPEIIKLPVKN